MSAIRTPQAASRRASGQDARAPRAGSATGAAFSPLYRQIKSLILQGLDRGEWKPGEAIPSEMDLAARFQVSQGTVRKAVDELAADNILVRRQGKGTFVATHQEEQVRFRFLRLAPDTDIPLPATSRVLECRRLRAPADVARMLELRAGDSVVQVRRVLSFNDVPTILDEIWLPGTLFKGLSFERLSGYRGPMYALFETEFGISMIRAEEKIRAVPASETDAAILGIAQGFPLLSVERVSYTYGDRPVELRRGLYITSDHYYRNSLN